MGALQTSALALSEAGKEQPRCMRRIGNDFDSYSSDDCVQRRAVLGGMQEVSLRNPTGGEMLLEAERGVSCPSDF